MSDERAVKETGVPITWLTYKAWRLGPVADEVYNPIKNVDSMQQLFETEYPILNSIQVAKSPSHLPEGLTLKAIHAFDDSRFSDYEVGVLDAVIDEYGKFTSEQLVDILHQEGSLWHQAVEKHQLQEQFDLKQNRSDYVLEFTKFLDTDFKKAAFEVAYQSYLMESNLL
ncbi:MAG: SocA family protein [Methylotenera sp.]|nr:SocA family protein [Flavobacterium sp.]